MLRCGQPVSVASQSEQLFGSKKTREAADLQLHQLLGVDPGALHPVLQWLLQDWG